MPSLPACILDLLDDREAKLIGFAASVLQISEYEFFRIAHQNWFNRPITENRLDCLFKDYLNTADVPFWANDFARKVHDKFKDGELNYKDYGIKRRAISRKERIKGWILVSLVLIFLTIYSYVISQYASY